MNDLVKFGAAGMPATPEDLAAGLANVGSQIQSNDFLLLRLLKSGTFAFGPEDIEPEEDGEWAVNPYSIMHGWVCWIDGNMVEEVMVPFTQNPPTQGELKDYETTSSEDGWKQQLALTLQCVSGEDAGTTVVYKGTSVGLKKAVKALIDDLVTQLQKDQVNIVPVVTLYVDSYKHQKYGKIFTPVLELQRFIPMDDPDAGKKETAQVEDQTADSGEDDAPAQEPSRRGRRRRGKAE